MNEIRYIDLFSGIGGFRLGLQKNNTNNKKTLSKNNISSEGNITSGKRGTWRYNTNFRCVWSNDIDKYANQVYTHRFGKQGHHSGDVRRVNTEKIPSFDLLCAGFPCQSFSMAGKRRGFRDTRGTLFFEICRIAEAKRPTWLLLENVRGLLSHDEGLTFQVILESLEELGYWCEWQVLNSKHHGVPQNRERVFIIGHLAERCSREIFPIATNDRLSSEREEQKTVGSLSGGGHSGGMHSDMTIIMEHAKITERSGEYGNGYKENESFCLDSSAGRDLRVHQGMKVRRLTPVECERLQGFPDNWTEKGLDENGELVDISDTQRYKMLGNAVTVNVIKFLGELMINSWC